MAGRTRTSPSALVAGRRSWSQRRVAGRSNAGSSPRAKMAARRASSKHAGARRARRSGWGDGRQTGMSTTPPPPNPASVDTPSPRRPPLSVAYRARRAARKRAPRPPRSARMRRGCRDADCDKTAGKPTSLSPPPPPTPITSTTLRSTSNPVLLQPSPLRHTPLSFVVPLGWKECGWAEERTRGGGERRRRAAADGERRRLRVSDAAGLPHRDAWRPG